MSKTFFNWFKTGTIDSSKGKNTGNSTDNPTAAQATSQTESSSTDENKAKIKVEITVEADKTPDPGERRKANIYNLIIVDESGSMDHLREATLSGINETINSIRSAQTEFADTQNHYLTLVTFDLNGSRRPAVRTIIDSKPIGKVKEFKKYQPCGSTPLYDAMGQSLTVLHNRIKNDKDATAVVTVLTDGLENASREWRAQQLRQLIEQLKEEGWSFSYMGSAHDVRGVTDLLSIDNVLEFSHDEEGARNTWDRERASREAYFMKMSSLYEMAPTEDPNDQNYWINLNNRKRQFAQEYYEDRITPNQIQTLGENEIFVFGSNKHGMHGGGAAATAVANFGAIMGQGEGLQGQSYAIPTMEGLDELRKAVDRFIFFAAQHPDLKFLVTRIGCGIAGYTPQQIAPLFRHCIRLRNVSLPIDFWAILGLKF